MAAVVTGQADFLIQETRNVVGLTSYFEIICTNR